jgi:hypothetical protein
MEVVMKHLLSKAAAAVTVAAAMSGTASAAPCLSNPADVVGNPIFGATVATFVSLGVNPATTCIENGLWTDPAGFSLGSYVKGAEGVGVATNPAVLGAYVGGGNIADSANARDFAWVQDTSANANPGGAVGSAPSQGIIWDLGGQANQVAIFVFVDHGPVPGEVLENTAWLSNDPNAADADWIQAQLVHVYGAGFSPDPDIADGFVAVYQLPGLATFSHVSVTWGGPGAIVRDGDNEIDAVGGLTVAGCAVGDTRPECLTPPTGTPEPGLLALLGIGFLGLILARKGQHEAA